MKRNPGAFTGRKIDGYGDCWYCSEVVVDPRVYLIDDPDSSERMHVNVCRKRRCREAADDGAFTRE